MNENYNTIRQFPDCPIFRLTLLLVSRANYHKRKVDRKNNQLHFQFNFLIWSRNSLIEANSIVVPITIKLIGQMNFSAIFYINKSTRISDLNKALLGEPIEMATRKSDELFTTIQLILNQSSIELCPIKKTIITSGTLYYISHIN